MSDGTPTDPNRKPLPWEPGAQPGPGPADPTVAWTAPGEPEPPAVEPTPPLTTPGLISAAPVGWTGQDIGAGPAPSAGSPPWLAPSTGTPTGPFLTSAPVGWAAPAPDRAREVPGAPGLVFAGTVPRFVAYVVDSLLLAIVASVFAASLGYGTTAVSESASGVTSWNYSVSGAAFVVPYTILSLAYALLFWTGGRRATPGQRIFALQVGNAFDGRGLTAPQAIRRWFGLGSAIGLLALLPRLENPANLISLLWALALLVSTVTSPTKQGLHDRLANSAVVRPAGQSSSGLATACLVLVIGLVVLAIVAIVGLIFLGGQMSEILEEMGRSI